MFFLFILLKVTKLLSCHCRKNYEAGKCCCIDLGLRCIDLRRLQQCDNSKIVEEDNDEGLSYYKTDTDDD